MSQKWIKIEESAKTILTITNEGSTKCSFLIAQQELSNKHNVEHFEIPSVNSWPISAGITLNIKIHGTDMCSAIELQMGISAGFCLFGTENNAQWNILQDCLYVGDGNSFYGSETIIHTTCVRN